MFHFLLVPAFWKRKWEMNDNLRNQFFLIECIWNAYTMYKWILVTARLEIGAILQT